MVMLVARIDTGMHAWYELGLECRNATGTTRRVVVHLFMPGGVNPATVPAELARHPICITCRFVIHLDRNSLNWSKRTRREPNALDNCCSKPMY